MFGHEKKNAVVSFSHIFCEFAIHPDVNLRNRQPHTSMWMNLARSHTHHNAYYVIPSETNKKKIKNKQTNKQARTNISNRIQESNQLLQEDANHSNWAWRESHLVFLFLWVVAT